MAERDTWHNRAKVWLGNTLQLDHSTLHVHVGMVIWLACVLIAGDIGALWPLAVVIAAELFNECLDRWRVGSWRIADTLADIVNSVLWPLVLFALARAGLIG
ncbi:MAG: hypothetical protein V4659_01435 [Pseudomonadota bacterium]